MLFVPAPHPPEFRRRAVDLARLGKKPISVIAQELSISQSCLRGWLAQDTAANSAESADDGFGDARLTSAEKRELVELRKEKQRLEVENEILKRAAAYFARENILPN
jgi:transposase